MRLGNQPQPPVSPSPPPSRRGVPYLVPHRNALLFRIRIPHDLQACLGKTEYRRSLGRCYHAEAKVRVLRLATAAHEVFLFAREALGHRDRTLTITEGEGTTTTSTDYAGYTDHRHQREDSQVVVVNMSNAPVSTSTLVHLQGRELGSLTDDEIREIADHWLLNALKGSNIFRLAAGRHLPGNAPNATEDDQAFHDAAESSTPQNIKAIWQKALKRQDVTKAHSATDKLLTHHGVLHTPEDKSTLPYLKACQEVMFYFPSAKGRKRAYEGEHLQKLIEKAKSGNVPNEYRMSLTTIKNHFTQIKIFINWAAQNEYISNNAITKLLKVNQEKQAHEFRDPFMKDDLIKIFNPKTYLPPNLSTRGAGKALGGFPSRFWVPLLGLFTGARLEELCQLHLNDIVAIDRDFKERRPTPRS